MKLCNACTQNALMERIEQNYEDFKKSTLQLDGESIFEYAPTIAAVQDAYFYMTTHDWADTNQTDCLLSFENPLKFLADAWEEESEDRGADFGDMLDNICADDFADFTEAYITVEVDDERRGKYSKTMPLDGAVISDIVELGKKLFKC